MKFDTNKVITRDNKNEAVVGQRYFFSDDRRLLESYVTADKDEHISILSAVRKEDGTYSFYDSIATSWRFVYPVEEEKFDKNKVISKENKSKAIVGKKYYFSDATMFLRRYVNAETLDTIYVLSAVVDGDSAFVNARGMHWEYIYPTEEEIKFDKSKMFSRENMYSLVLGKRYYVSDSVERLEGYVNVGSACRVKTIAVVRDREWAFVDSNGVPWRFAYPVEEETFGLDRNKIISKDNMFDAVIGRKYFFCDDLEGLAERAKNPAKAATLEYIAPSHSMDMVFKRAEGLYWKYLYPVDAPVSAETPKVNGYEVLSFANRDKAVVGQRYVFADKLSTFEDKDYCATGVEVLGQVAQGNEGVGDMVFRKEGRKSFWRYICPVDAFVTHPKPPLGLKPRTIHDEQRRDEIINACNRYIEAKKAIPYEWIEELFENYNRVVRND